MCSIIVHCRGALGYHPSLVNKKLKDIGVDLPSGAKNQQIETAKTEAKEDYMPFAFLSGTNIHRYGMLMNELHNTFSMGWDEYPNTLTDAYDLAIN